MKLSRGGCSVPHPVSWASDLSWGHIPPSGCASLQSSSHWRTGGPHCWEQHPAARMRVGQHSQQVTRSRGWGQKAPQSSPTQGCLLQVFVGCSFVHFCVLRNLSVIATVKASQKLCDVMLRQIKVCNVIPERFSLLITPEHSCSYVTVLHPHSGFFSCS